MPHNQGIPEGPLATSIEEVESLLIETARKGAQQILQRALEAEIEAHLDANREKLDEDGHRQVVRNGHAPQRTILTGVGPLEVSRPRVDERKASAEDPDHEVFASGVLPRFLRRTPSVEGLVAVLYLKGISTNDFDTALRAIYGEQAPSLSASTVSRLKDVFTQEYERWRKERISSSRYAYIWADGVYFNARVEGERNCVLVVVGATFNGDKELLAITNGVRESEVSWKELLLDLKDRGMSEDPKLAIADGALGFWKALPQVFPSTQMQRCWVHKTANVLNKLPKSAQPRAKTLIHDIYRAETEENAVQAFNHFCDSYRDKYPEAVTCLDRDRKVMLNFYGFPAAHWKHIRSTNVIESVFATVRLRTYKTKGMGTSATTLAMGFKLIREAEKSWRKITRWQQLELVQNGRVFKDGVLVPKESAA
jgi:transposase-like protein